MANLIQHKRSSTPGVVPTSGNLSYGELAINYSDGKLYTKNNSNNIINLPVASISGASITPGQIYVDNLRLDGNTISSTNIGGGDDGSIVVADSISLYSAASIEAVTPTFNFEYGNSVEFYDTENEASVLYVGDKVGILKTNPATALDVNGTVTATTFSGAGTNLTGTASSLTAGSVTTNANLTGDVTSTGNATAIAAGVIVNADINAAAAIADTKLATISTAGKVANSATTATNANTASAIVARDASGNFSAGTITVSNGISLANSVSNNINFNSNGLSTPSSAFTPTSNGIKIILHPFTFGSSSTFGFGIAGSGTTGQTAPAQILWSQVGNTSHSFKWYAGTTNIATLTGAGNFTLNSASSAINASSAYFGGVNIGGYLAGGAVGSLQIWSDVDDLIFSADDGGIYSVGSLYADGNIRFIPETSSTLYLNGQVSFERVSNTELKIKMRGTDGVTRSTTLTLS